MFRAGIFLFPAFVLLAGCALAPSSVVSTPKTARALGEGAVAQTLAESQQSVPPASLPALPIEVFSESADEKTPHEIENLTIGEVIRLEEPNTQSLYDNSRYDFPITVNARVEAWIDYFTGRGRGHMERYLGRSSRYIPVMKQILKREGLPEDLVYLALIESGFNLRASSRARAVGPWQFMKATGQRYGLRVDAWIDERRDPIRSTEAAARYLKDLYLMFESWYLAASAYNAGEYKILRAIEQLKTNNYWRICETNLLRRETKDYIPKLIAAAIIGKNADRYGFDDIEYLDPLQFDTVTVDKPISLRQISNIVKVSVDDISDLNPELRRAQVPPGLASYEIRVPPGSRVLVERSLNTLHATQGLPSQYRVQPGDSLGSIGRKYRVSVRELAAANNLSPREKLAPGLSLILPNRDSTRVAASRQTSNGPQTPQSKRISESKGFFSHIVRRGESLWSISERYNVTVQDLFRWNGLKRSQIHPGKQIRVKGTRGAAS